jgi:hypothetical protein
MEFPILVYRCPGEHFGPNGTTYESTQVHDDSQLNEMISAGWKNSLPSAVEFYLIGDPEESEVDQFDSAPTRAEIEEKATELGIKFDGRTTNRKLIEKIQEVLRG